MGWERLINGALLSEAEKNGFTVMLTADKSIKSPQSMKARAIAVIILRAFNTKLATHIPMMVEVNQLLLSIQPGEVVEVFHPDMKP